MTRMPLQREKTATVSIVWATIASTLAIGVGAAILAVAWAHADVIDVRVADGACIVAATYMLAGIAGITAQIHREKGQKHHAQQ